MGTIGRAVAKGPTSPKCKGQIGIFGPPRPNTVMATPCPCILVQWTEQGAAAFIGGPHGFDKLKI